MSERPDGCPARGQQPLTAEGFAAWLTARVDDWCRDNGLTPLGEGCDLGDLYRELEEAEAWAAIGVTLVPDYAEQVLYVLGPGTSWVATTGIETGTEGETIWFDPLSNLRIDVPVDDLRRYRDRLRRDADELNALLGE